tara:strand:- start:1901 stop:2293 length:393 start_codon:yes stop_codon:yes gene_type:complete
MSTLKVNTIQNTSGGSSSTPDQIEKGRAKVWVEFSGAGAATEINSFGVSSVNRRSNGNYEVFFSSNFSNTNYVVFATSGANVDNYADLNDDIDNIAIVCNKFVDKVYIGCGDLDDGVADDQPRVSVLIFT